MITISSFVVMAGIKETRLHTSDILTVLQERTKLWLICTAWFRVTALKTHGMVS